MTMGRNGLVYGAIAGLMLTSDCGGNILLGSNDRYPRDSGSEDAGTGIALVVDGAPESSSDSLGGSGGDGSSLSIVAGSSSDSSPCTVCTSDSDCSTACGPIPQNGYFWCCVPSVGLCAAQSYACANSPTWNSIWSNDLNQKTCNSTPACHAQWTTASGAYSYLQSQGCIPALGCITGFGAPGNMPLFGTLSSAAVADIQAWIAAGSPNN